MKKTLNTKLIAVAAVAGLGFPMLTSAAQVAGERLDIYGLLRLSLDYGNTGDEDVRALSSNTTLVGLRGVIPVEGSRLAGVWQVEQVLNANVGGGSLASRDTFIGLRTDFGTFRAGLIDTPYKNMGIRNTLGTTTLADPHALLGYSADRVYHLNRRDGNAVQWDSSILGVQLAAQVGGIGSNESYSGSAAYSIGPVGLAAAFMHLPSGTFTHNVNHPGEGNWVPNPQYDGSNEPLVRGPRVETLDIDTVNALRLAANYRLGPARVGVLYEHIESDFAAFNRQTFGLNAIYTVLPGTTVGGQWLRATDSDAGNDGADSFAAIVFHNLAPQIQVHAAAVATLNADQGRYPVAGYAHGNRIDPAAAGQDVWAVSLGGQLAF